MVLYTTECPKCKVLLKKMEQKGVEFVICRDISKMEELGIMSSPVLEVEGKLLLFKEAVDYINELT